MVTMIVDLEEKTFVSQFPGKLVSRIVWP